MQRVPRGGAVRCALRPRHSPVGCPGASGATSLNHCPLCSFNVHTGDPRLVLSAGVSVMTGHAVQGILKHCQQVASAVLSST